MSSAKAQLDHAYAICRGVTREAARNFYYAFRVLPAEKRDALSAVYAFMRHADDISDDPELPFERRRAALAEWLDKLHAVVAGHPTDDPVLLALADAQAKFQIPVELFDRLVEGTAMDVKASAPGDPNASQIIYPRFNDLERYCYHVASVVGLICIRIFGYSDPKAEPLAEKCGLAFQLTNILRDVKEDALMGRVYLPEEDLEQFGRSAAELAPARLKNGFDAAVFRPVLEFEYQRAKQLYAAGDELLPLIHEDSQPALWVLVTIYRRLLERIAQRDFNVFGERIALSTAEKLRVLGKGFLRRLAL